MSKSSKASTTSDGLPRMADAGDEAALAKLNKSLSVLVTVFPRVLPEVFREMLQTFDGDSRLQTVVEQLLKHQDQWVRGRWRTDLIKPMTDAKSAVRSQQRLFAEDEFRRASYKWAARKMLYEEFKVLSRTKIEAVLAEENFCYSRARLALQNLASRTWRSTFSALFSRLRKSNGPAPKNHYLLATAYDEETHVMPNLRSTGDAELDLELHESVLKPYLEKIKIDREAEDWATANAINEAEAKHYKAIYECACCYSDTTFEQMASCTNVGHVICFQCIRHVVSESLFGQGWERNVNHVRGQVKCIALMSEESCDGFVPPSLTQRAVLQSTGGKETMAKLESRLAEEAIAQCRIPLVHCPFCAYAEADELYFPPSTIRYKLNSTDFRNTFRLFLIVPFLLLVLFIYGLLSYLSPLHTLPRLTDMFSESLASISRAKYLPGRFQCRSPQCGLSSCLICMKEWQDPHVCHESAKLSLRTTVEAARTAALKRTCPRCRLGFVKDSGCNKLTCTCGYSMCYICRQGLGRVEGGEGYRHFCQHFRPAGGACKECDRCDLYKNEDDEASVQRAGALAERQWREKEGMTGVEGIGIGQQAVRWPSRVHPGRIQGLLNWCMKVILTC